MQQLTPKKEAIQLVEKFYVPYNLTIQTAKECAIICVNKVLSVINSDALYIQGETNIGELVNHYCEVLQEISKL